MLIRALALVEAGDVVTIVDRAPWIGGAWTTPPLVGLASVECGVHLLENRPHFYAALRRLEIGLERDDHCATHWHGQSLKMGPARILFHALVAINAMRRGQIDRFCRTALSAARSALHLSTPFLYPTAGCRELNQRLAMMLARHGITPILNMEITSIQVDRATGVRCSTPGGEIAADRVVIASRAHANLVIDQCELRPPLERNRITTLILRGKDALRTPISYIEILRDPHFKRVRDVTPFCLPRLDENEFVFTVQLRDSGERLLAADGVEAIFDHLADLGLLSDSAQLSHTAVCDYAYQTIPNAALRAIERQARGRIMVVQTTDFADGFDRAGRHPPD